MRYTICDPTGNITALVESEVAIAEQPRVATLIMERHPEVEQVGFVTLGGDGQRAGHVLGHLRMAGGEFCGNATICAAALLAIRAHVVFEGQGVAARVLVSVSGAAEPVEVQLARTSQEEFSACVSMPPAAGVGEVGLEYEAHVGKVPLVSMEGISHVVIDDSSPLFALLEKPEAAEAAVRRWCHELRVAGLGCMFFAHEGDTTRLTPLVFVPGADTVFWESSCASGTCAVGMAEAWRRNGDVDLALSEPKGILRVVCDACGNARLHGHVRLMGSYEA